MSCRAGPCWLVSYRGMKDNDIMSYRTLLLHFPTEEWRIRMSCRTGPCYFISYKRMEDKDVVQDRPLLSEDVPVTRSSCSNAISGSYDSVLQGNGLDNCVLFSLETVSKLRGWVGNYRTCTQLDTRERE